MEKKELKINDIVEVTFVKYVSNNRGPYGVIVKMPNGEIALLHWKEAEYVLEYYKGNKVFTFKAKITIFSDDKGRKKYSVSDKRC